MLGVTITGANTHWVQGTTQMILGAGISIANLTIVNPTTATADIQISPTAPQGGSGIVAITGGEVASGASFGVSKGAYQILSVTPSLVTQNQTLTVSLVGQATHWLQGGTVADFGGGINVDQLTITDPTHATAQITILSQAGVGFRPVSMNTDGEIATINQGLDVEQGTPTLLSSTPNSGQQGETKNIQILGRFTHWTAGNTNVAIGGTGITVNSVTVQDSATLTANITIDPVAYIDTSCRGLTVTAGTEQVSLIQQFCVARGPAQLTNLRPATTKQGSTVTVHIIGQNTHFVNGTTTASFDSGVNVSNVTVLSATTADVDIAASVNAPTGFHDVTLYTLGEIATIQNTFQVTPGVPTLNGVSPVSAQQGTTLTLHIISQFTHFVQGTTTATLGQGITLNSLAILDATTADANVTIDPIAYTGSRTTTMTTGTEIVSGTFFSVTPSPAIISGISPSVANQGQNKIVTITGQGTHWVQGLTQFSMGGAGYDVTVNGFVVTSPTSAFADITFSPTASLGARGIYMSTGGEVLSDNGAFLVTGGIPSITYLSPGSAIQGATAVNVNINGVFTNWTGSTTVDFGPGITVTNLTVNSSTSLTAVINLDPAATLGYNTVTVRTGAQALTSSFLIQTSAPPTPYIYYLSPSVGLPGQTFNVSIVGQYTHWDLTTHVTFGAGIAVNTFQVTGVNTALANITIDPSATAGGRTVTLTTGSEVETAGFSVVIATPYISIVDPSSALQGETGKTINVVGQYTTWDNTTVFNFGSGVTINSTTVLGPTIAQVNVAVAQLATLGGRGITATTGAHVDTGCCFSVTPSLANITSITPNTAKQNDVVSVSIVGQFTHFQQGVTSFNLGGGISVSNVNVTSATTATATLTVASLASLGNYGITGTTAGENAYLPNAFVVQPGTPLILSSAPTSIQQQNSLNVTVIGQFTSWTQATTTADFGAGTGITVNSVSVTNGGEGITLNVSAAATTPLGYRTLYVTTGAQVLTLPNALYVTNGPAAITQLTPSNGSQGQTSLSVAVLGTNTNFLNGTTAANFGQGVSVNSLTVTDPTHATANITISANATPGFNTVYLSTFGETAAGTNAFLINAATPVTQSVSPNSSTQGTTLNVNILASFTHFVQGNTTADFGTGVTVNSVTVNSATTATVSITLSPTATTGLRNVSMITNLGGGGQEVAVKSNAFTVNPSAAAISSLNPATGRQNQTALQIAVTGTGTHFDNTTTIGFGFGTTTTLISNVTPTSLTATINIDPNTSIGTRTVTATTGGEIAQLTNGFTVTAGLPAVTSASPASAHQNDTLNVQVGGIYTHFVQGTTTANFGAGITVNGTVTVQSSNQATVNVTIAPGATVGARAITMTTGGEIATLASAFTVTAGVPQLSSINPTTGPQASTQTMTITGLFTNFAQGVSAVSFSGSGVTAGTVTVNGPTQITVPVTVTAGANAGSRTVTVVTNSEVVSLNNSFTVLPGAPTITLINPTVGVPNTASLNVAITGQFTNFVNGTTQVTFGPGISVNGAALGAYGTVSVSNPTYLTANISIDAAAALGARDIIVKTGAEIITVNNGFTVQSLTPVAPTIISVTPFSGQGNVPLNTSYKAVFNGPVDPSTVLSTNVRISSNGCGGNAIVPATLSVDASGRVITMTPSSVLAVGQSYSFSVNYYGAPYVFDPSAHQVSYYCYTFSTGFAVDNTGPTFLSSNLATGDIGIGTNVLPLLGFDKALDPSTQPSGLTVMQGATPVPGVWSYNSDYTQATFNPAGGFAANTAYAVNYTSSLKDGVGNTLVNPGVISFTTGAGPDNTAATLISYTPTGTTTGTNPLIKVVFSKAMNPLSMTQGQFYLNRTVNNHVIPGTNVVVSPDRTTFTLTLSAPLDPQTNYQWYYGPAYDQAQHYTGYGYITFTTGATVDNAGPTITYLSPANGSSAIPVNSPVQVEFSEAVAPTSIANSLSLSPAVAGTISQSSDLRTVVFTPTAALATSQLYHINIAGITDLSGNAAITSPSSFTTAGSATPDTTHGTISEVPASGAVNVPTNAAPVFTFSKTINPIYVNTNDVRLYDNTAGTYVPGTVTINAALNAVTFTPTVPMQGNHQMCAYVGYHAYIYDIAGNSFNYLYNNCFTTAAGVDLTAPTVISMMPSNNATGIGPNNPVTVTFSKPMNPTTLQNTNVAMFIGGSLYTQSFYTSFDSTTLSFNVGNMPYNTTFSVVITPNVTDLAGNHLAAQYVGTFTTAPQPVIARPTITSMRPVSGSTGVDPSSAITFYLSAPLNTATVPGAVKISQNGVLITGNITYQSNNQVVVFQPGSPLQAGANIQSWFTSAALDTSGNSVLDYMASFTVAPDYSAVAPVILSTSPTQYSSGNLRNSIVEVKFSKPMDPSTVNGSNFFVRDCSNLNVAGSLSLRSNNTVIRFTPLRRTL